MTTLRFTEDELRAFGNTLDRASIEIEASEGAAQGEEEEQDYRNNLRDYDTAIAVWGRVTAAAAELLDGPVRACTVVDGVLTCPDGHSGDIQHQEQEWQQRSVLGVEDGVLKIEGSSRTLDNSGSGEGLYCMDCGVQYEFPAGVPIDYV